MVKLKFNIIEDVVVFFILSFFMLLNVVHADMNDNTGTTSAQFLRIGIGARAGAMADAYTAIADDSTSVYWNPAGLNHIHDLEIYCMYHEWFEDMSFGSLGAVFPVKSIGAFGISGSILHLGSFVKTLEDSNGLYSGEKGTFTAYDWVLGLSWANSLFIEQLSFGLTVKVIQQVNADMSANAFAGDIGAQYKTPIKKLTAGFALQNMGTSVQMGESSFSLPMIIKVGAGYEMKLMKRDLLLALDIAKPSDDNLFASFGLDYAVYHFIFIRCGYKYRLEGNDVSGIRAGMGGSYKRFFFDYAFVPVSDLGYNHNITLRMRFSSAKPEKEDTEVRDDESFNSSVLIRESFALVREGDIDGAKERLILVKEREPENKKAYYLLGRIYRKEKEYTKAINMFEDALSIDQDYAKCYYQLGCVYYQIEKYRDAKEYFNQYLTYKNNDEKTMVYLVEIDKILKKDEKPDDKKEKKEDKNDVDQMFKQGRQLAKDKKYDEAKRVFENIMVKDPENKKAYYNYALVYYKEKDLDRCKVILKDLTDNFPDYEKAHYLLGITYYKLNDNENASSAFEKVLRINPDHSKAKKMLKKIRGE